MEANRLLHFLHRPNRKMCPRCGKSPGFCRAARRNIWERAISILVLPFHCECCDRRFFRVTPPAALIRGLRERTGRLALSTMTYGVVLTKWRALALLAAVCCLAALLFFGGVPVGVGLWQPMREEIQMAKESLLRQPNTQAAVRAATAAPVPAPEQAAAPGPPRETAAPANAAPPTPPPASPASLAAHKSKAQPAADEPPPFVVQIGAFRDAKNAKQLQDELNGRGYQATVFNALDSEQRMWHVVRVGRYQDLASAASDAEKIGDKEQMQVLIRRGDRL
jgi:nucleoid-associated protein YgaU